MIEFPRPNIPRGPIAYVAWAGKKCLYVGMSSRGLQRVFENIKIQQHWDYITKFQVHPCDSTNQALLKERDLTIELKPIIGGSHRKEVGKKFKSSWSPMGETVAPVAKVKSPEQLAELARIRKAKADAWVSDAKIPPLV